MNDGQPTTEDGKLLLELAKKAGVIGLKYFKSQNEVRYKSGNSPVSEADDAIDNFLRESFASERPDYGWLSEETEDNSTRLAKSTVVIADPIDGTRGFIQGRDEWCISIAIVEGERPIEAILHCPAANRTFIASKGKGFSLIGKPAQPHTLTKRPYVTGSKKLIELMGELEGRPFDFMPFVPSLAYRIALIAIGELDGAFARPGASEWDIVAADLILEEAGGKITDKDGKQIIYNQEKVTLPALIAGSDIKHDDILSLAKENGIIQ